MVIAAQPQPRFRTRTDVLFASRAPLAVVLRRGPRKHYQLLLWNTDKDEFTPGQWMKGVVALCDLSADGRKIIYFAAQEHPSAPWRRNRPPRQSTPSDDVDTDEDLASQGFDPVTVTTPYLREFKKRHPKRKLARYLGGSHIADDPSHTQIGTRINTGTWTAVSTPPYFSALAIWPSNGRWTGGGFFRDTTHLIINENAEGIRPIANVRLPQRIRIDGYHQRPVQPVPTTRAHSPRSTAVELHHRVETALRAGGATFVDWIYPAPDGSLLFACDGTIYRQPRWADDKTSELLQTATRLIDLAPNRFDFLAPPPEAMRW